MGGRGSGRKPQPLALKVFKGGRVRNDRTYPELQSDPVETMPEPPAWLGEVAQNHWRTDGESLCATGLLAKQDLNDFALVCAMWERLRQLHAEAEGLSTVMTSKGEMKTHPALAEFRRWIPLVRSVRSDYGLSGPASRQIKTPADDSAVVSSPLNQFQAMFNKAGG